jgi:hypothetical protein
LVVGCSGLALSSWFAPQLDLERGKKMHALQAITVKIIPATDRRGTRVKAVSCSGISATVAWDHEKSPEENAADAGQALMDKMEWAGYMVGGATKSGWVFVTDTGDPNLMTIGKRR